jgi:hypothetical protein
MNIKHATAALAFLSLIGGGGSAWATGVNLITNGNFSTVTQGATSLIETNGYGAVVTGWTTTSTYSFLLNASNASSGFYNGNTTTGSLYTGTGTLYQTSLSSGIVASPAGGNFSAQDGNYNQGTLSQTVSGLTVGDTYAVQFYQAAAQQTGFVGSTTDQWVVTLGGQTDYSPQISIGQGAFSGWSYVTEYFTATATTESLGFFANGTGAPPFALLDGVSLVDAPEPATWTVMIMGLLGVASARRWARTRR